MNLHHRLYVEAGGIDRPSAADLASGAMVMGRSSPTTDPAWREAVAAYAGIAKRDLLFDRGNVAINDALGLMSGDEAVAADTIEPSIRAALIRAAPIYRAQDWPRQRAINDAWIAEMQPRVDRHAPALIRALARAYHTDWPSRPILIDVAGDAGQFGAYTTNAGPAGFAAHATMAPAGHAAEGDTGLESIFHEASHASDASIMRAITAECAAQNVRPPRLLWHALIFYSVGELVRQELGKVGDAHYLPYAYRFDVYAKGMANDRPALEQDWQPYLDGKVPYEEALRNLVRDATR